MTGPVRRLVGITALLVLLEVVLPGHGRWPPGSTAVLGVVGSLLLGGFAKWLGGAGIARPEPSDE